jgi:hypothetical protein
VSAWDVRCARCSATTPLLYAEEGGWIQTGDGWFCDSHAPLARAELPETPKPTSFLSAGSSSSSTSTSPSPSLTPEEDEEAEVEWLLRAHAADDIKPELVELSLPPSATPSLETVAEFFGRVYGLRRLHPGLRDKPVLFACDWVAKHTGLSGPGVWKALNRLVVAGVLRRAGVLPPRGNRRAAHLFLPANAVDVEAPAEDAGAVVQPAGEPSDNMGGADLVARGLEAGAAGDGAAVEVGHGPEDTPEGYER